MRLDCAQMAECINILFWMNTLVAQGTLCYMGVLFPCSEGEVGGILPIVDPLRISKMAGARDFKFGLLIDGSVP